MCKYVFITNYFRLKRDEHFDVEDIFIEWSRTIDDVRLESEIAIH